MRPTIVRHGLSSRAKFNRICALLRIICALSAFAFSVAASADDITLQIGGRFSVYAPTSCGKVEQLHFSLVLDCDFRGTAVRFYMKELPTQPSEESDPHKPPASKQSEMGYLDSALHAVADELDPDMVSRLTILWSGSTHGEDTDALFWEEGHLNEHAKNDDGIGKCVFLRVQTSRRGPGAVLFAISDLLFSLPRTHCRCVGGYREK